MAFRLPIAGSGAVGSMPSGSFARNNSTAKPASADMNEKATQANSRTNKPSTIHSRIVTPPT